MHLKGNLIRAYSVQVNEMRATTVANPAVDGTTRLRLLVLVALIAGSVALTVVGPTTAAWACSCVAQTDAERFEGAADVFIGTPVLVNDADPLLWEFAVDSVQKGQVGVIQLVAIPRYQVEDCGFNFVPGRRYQVFGGTRDGVVFTEICAGTRDLTSGLTPYLPGEPAPPSDEGSTSTAPPPTEAPPTAPPPTGPTEESDPTVPVPTRVPPTSEPGEPESPDDADGAALPPDTETPTAPSQPLAQEEPNGDDTGNPAPVVIAVLGLLAIGAAIVFMIGRVKAR